MKRLGVCVLLLAACSSDNSDTATTTTERVTTTTENPRYALTAADWSGETRTSDEEAFEQATSFTFGIGTNPDKMLEYGYDLCERYETRPEAAAIADWATETGQPPPIASELGAAASRHLC